MKTEKQQQAYNLYFQTGLSQAEIARLLDVDRKTIHNWMSDGHWRELKKASNHMPSKLAEQLYFMLANLNHEILSRAHQPYPRPHEVEELRKIAICIRHVKNRQTVNESMEAFTHLADRIMDTDPELAMRMRPHIQDYIKTRADFRLADSIPAEYRIDPNMGQLFDYEIRPYDDSEPSTPADPTDPSGNLPVTVTPNDPDAPTINDPEPILVAA
jgi:predicted DNA-binding protein YlxM (UPF0122 family)